MENLKKKKKKARLAIFKEFSAVVPFFLIFFYLFNAKRKGDT